MKRLTIGLAACTETLAVMIAMAWADGRLDDREKDGVRGAARVLNLPGDLRTRLDGVLEKPAKIGELQLAQLGAREKAFAYVAAAWMAGVDEAVGDEEKALLADLAAALGLDATRQEELAKIARDLDPPAKGARDWAQELTRLFKAIPPRLETSEDEFEVAFE